MFAWVGLDRVSLREVSRRLAEAGVATSTGRARWDPTTIALMLRNTAYVGRAVFGRSRHVQAPPRLRPLRGLDCAPGAGRGHAADWTGAGRWVSSKRGGLR